MWLQPGPVKRTAGPRGNRHNLSGGWVRFRTSPMRFGAAGEDRQRRRPDCRRSVSYARRGRMLFSRASGHRPSVAALVVEGVLIPLELAASSRIGADPKPTKGTTSGLRGLPPFSGS